MIVTFSCAGRDLELQRKTFCCDFTCTSRSAAFNYTDDVIRALPYAAPPVVMFRL